MAGTSSPYASGLGSQIQCDKPREEAMVDGRAFWSVHKPHVGALPTKQSLLPLSHCSLLLGRECPGVLHVPLDTVLYTTNGMHTTSWETLIDTVWYGSNSPTFQADIFLSPPQESQVLNLGPSAWKVLFHSIPKGKKRFTAPISKRFCLWRSALLKRAMTF